MTLVCPSELAWMTWPLGMAQQEVTTGGIGGDEIDPRVTIDQVDMLVAIPGPLQIDVEAAQHPVKLRVGPHRRQGVQRDGHRRKMPQVVGIGSHALLPLSHGFVASGRRGIGYIVMAASERNPGSQ
jgi:hypothetical protein